jgi:hypothetical protein
MARDLIRQFNADRIKLLSFSSVPRTRCRDPQRPLPDEISGPKLPRNSPHVSLPLPQAGAFLNACREQGIARSARGADRRWRRRRQQEARGSRATSSSRARAVQKSQKQWSRHGDLGVPLAEIGRSRGFSTISGAENAPTRPANPFDPSATGVAAVVAGHQRRRTGSHPFPRGNLRGSLTHPHPKPTRRGGEGDTPGPRQARRAATELGRAQPI